jgi:hypothetical protein
VLGYFLRSLRDHELSRCVSADSDDRHTEIRIEVGSGA